MPNKYAEISKNKELLEILKENFIHIEKGKFVSEFDSEIMTVLALPNSDHTQKINYIYSFFPDDELLLHSRVKTATCWSLLANARQHNNVKIIFS